MSNDFSSVPNDILPSSPVSSELEGCSSATHVYGITHEDMPASGGVEGKRGPPYPYASDFSDAPDVTRPMALAEQQSPDGKTVDLGDHLAKRFFSALPLFECSFYFYHLWVATLRLLSLNVQGFLSAD